MQINSWIGFVVFSMFTLAVMLVGIPISLYLFIKGIKGFIKYRCSKLPDNYLIDHGFGTYSYQIILYGLFIFISSIWYLFFDKGGQLFNLISNTKFFFLSMFS